MPILKGMEAWVEMEGVKLQEYQPVTNEQATEVTCWIPCEAGKALKIGCALPTKRPHHLKFRFTIDGDSVYLRGRFITKHEKLLGNTRYFSEERVEAGTATRGLQFGTLELTDDEVYLETAKQFGEISVEVWSYEKSIYVPERKSQSGASQTPAAAVAPTDNYRVHERSKKGLTHCVKFGEEKPIVRSARSTMPGMVSKIVGLKHICTFIFKYRHMDILLADGIAPHSNAFHPSRLVDNSQAAGTKRKIDRVKKEDDIVAEIIKNEDDDKDAEIRRLKAQLAALESKGAGSAGAGPSSKRVKRERATSAFVPGEVIDLTI